MGITLPDAVSSLLNELGYDWPNTDEGDVFSKGKDWLSFAKEAKSTGSHADDASQQVLSKNEGNAMEAFRQSYYSDQDSVQDVSKKIGTGSSIVGACMVVMAGVIIALKVVVIVQLVSALAEIIAAIAAATPTLGASLAWIPIAKKIASMAIDYAINIALNKLMS